MGHLSEVVCVVAKSTDSGADLPSWDPPQALPLY